MGLVKRTKRRLRRRLQAVTALSAARWYIRLTLSVSKFVGLPFRTFPVVGFSQVSQQLDAVAAPASSEVAAPVSLGRDAAPYVASMPALHVRHFQKALASDGSSAVLVDKAIALPNHHVDKPDRSASDDDFLLWHGNDQLGVLCLDRKPTRRASGIPLFGTGTSNWYHWLIEQLPIAFLAEQLPDTLDTVPFVVPDRVLDMPSFRDSLAVFSPDRTVEPLGQAPCRFDDLYVIDGPVHEPFNMPSGVWPRKEDYLVHTDVMRAYRQTLLHRLGIEPGPAHRRVFLARDPSRRSYNQEAAIGIASEFGFEVVQPEKLSFKEQVRLMHDAQLVVGPSGAAFANTLFCQPGAQLLSWVIPEYRGFCSYMNIAAIAQTELRYLFTPTDNPINSTVEAFAATYTLDLTAFRDALAQMDRNATA